MQISNLRIEVADKPLNEYRINGKMLEFRTLAFDGRPFSDERGTWKRLTANELLLHFRFNTAVGRWYLEKTAEWGSPAAQQELGKVA